MGPTCHTSLSPQRNNYVHYHVDETPSLRWFQSYLTGLDGGERNAKTARKYAADVSKFLYFSSKSRSVNWWALADIDMVRSYLKQLSDDGIAVDGRLEKLECIRLGISFCFVEANLDSTTKGELTAVNDRINSG